jgi:hypothetical protein
MDANTTIAKKNFIILCHMILLSSSSIEIYYEISQHELESMKNRERSLSIHVKQLFGHNNSFFVILKWFG